MSVDLKGYKRGKMPNKAQLLDRLLDCKERYEHYLLENNIALTNWFEGRCESLLNALGYEYTRCIVGQWRNEVLDKYRNEAQEETKEPVQAVCFSAQPVANGAEVPVLAGDDHVNCPHCQQQVTTHLDGMGDNARVRCDECNGDLNFEPDEVAGDDHDELVYVGIDNPTVAQVQYAIDQLPHAWQLSPEEVGKIEARRARKAQPVANGAEVPVLEGIKPHEIFLEQMIDHYVVYTMTPNGRENHGKIVHKGNVWEFQNFAGIMQFGGGIDDNVSWIGQAKRRVLEHLKWQKQTLCDGCHEADCICDYLAAERYMAGETDEVVGFAPFTMQLLDLGILTSEDFLPND